MKRGFIQHLLNLRMTRMNGIPHEGAGFTLIELLIAIGVMSILIGASAFSLSLFRERGRDVKRQSDIRTLQEALQEYYADQGFYPAWGSLPLDVLRVTYGADELNNRMGNPNCPGPSCPPLRVYLHAVPHDPRECLSGCPVYRHYCYEGLADINDAPGPGGPLGPGDVRCDNVTTMCTYYTLDTTLGEESVVPPHNWNCYDRPGGSVHVNNYRVTPLGTPPLP